jgi:hypothetical protein
VKGCAPALAGLVCPVAGGVHEAGLITADRTGSAVVGEIAGGYRPAGDLLPPLFPLIGGLGWLPGGQQRVSAERAACVLPG